MGTPCASAPVKRDWLWGLRCRLCGRDNPGAGAARFTQDWVGVGRCMPRDDVERCRIAHEVCWWCFYRIATWKDRHHQGFGLTPALTTLDVIEFTAHVLKKQPAWLGKPNAYHCRMTRAELVEIGFVKKRNNQYTNV